MEISPINNFKMIEVYTNLQISDLKLYVQIFVTLTITNYTATSNY